MRGFCTILLAALLVGCAVNSPKEPEKTIEQETTDINTTAPQAAKQEPAKIKPPKLALNGAILNTFHTILPCADCGGAKTILTLKKDKTYEKITLFLRDDGEILVEKGKLEPLQNAIKLTSDDGKSSFFTPKNGSLIQLTDERTEHSGVLAEIYRFDPVNKEYKESFFAQWSKFQNSDGFQKMVVSAGKNGANISIHSSLANGEPICRLEGELRYEGGIFYYEKEGVKFSLHRLDNAIFVKNEGEQPCKFGRIEGKYTNGGALTRLFGGRFLGSLTPQSHNADIVRIYGAKNIKKDSASKDKNIHIVFDSSGAKLFKFELTNGKITYISVLSDKFSSPEGAKLGMKFKELKELLKPDEFAVSNGKISLKFLNLNAVFKLKTSSKADKISNVQQIPNEATISEILLFWND